MNDDRVMTNKSLYNPVWTVIIVAFSIFMCFINSKLPGHPGFFVKSFGVIVCIVLGFIGFFIGDVVRKFAVPDAIITSGGMTSIIKHKLFWLFGPQIIGIAIGIGVGGSKFFSLFT